MRIGRIYRNSFDFLHTTDLLLFDYNKHRKKTLAITTVRLINMNCCRRNANAAY